MAVSLLLCFAVSAVAKAANWKASAENPLFYEGEEAST